MEVHSQYRESTKVTITLYIGLFWFLLALAGSLTGVFVSGPGQPPLAIGLAIIVPILVFVISYKQFEWFRSFVLSVSPQTIPFLQINRVIGIVFVILAGQGSLSPLFAYPAGWGDFAIGLTAPLVALAYAANLRSGRTLLILWNILGLLDLIIAFSLGVLVATSDITILTEAGTGVVVLPTFPLSLIPTFVVPVSVILHLVNLNQLLKKSAR